jgi:hypothetical protein
MLPLYGQLPTQLNESLLQAAAAALAAQNNTNSASSDSTPTGSRDTTYTKIFVGGLPYHTTDKTLHDYFRQFGDIEEAVVITDRQTQKSRGYGFVTMKERSDAEKACKDPNPIIDGRKANVNLAYLGAKPRNNVPLSGTLAGLQQLPLQTQLQALLPGRLGIPQLFYPTATAATTNHSLMNQSLAQFAAVAQAQQLNQANAAAAAAAHAHQNSAMNYLDYATLAAAAAAGQSASSLIHPSVSAASVDQYITTPYGMLPTSATYAAQLNAQAQLVAASGAGHTTIDNQRLS